MDVQTMRILFSNIFPFADTERMAYIFGLIVRQGLFAVGAVFPASGYPP